ncbi:helix-turn-helix domain-containing protein [Nocardiopsis metallicus]|uniref:Transcriptional regulator with XRE-family HTH domain n=1 Tax=Nocardiopsis metallicus TaxID=179819 RepID=A0A840WH65_9ACTN|nr:helix-turn-helix transcriptional regulator [Nocardiopsis metallicus]MBB5494803.1 transcriptional regulator with XRE-family HTH domain [Nocardiopsis metallicus]
MTDTDRGASIGERIAIARKLAGLSQQALAQRANYSLSMVRAVEQGREPASAHFVAATAEALGIQPQDVYGQPFHDLLAQDGGVSSGIAALQALLAEGTYARGTQPAPVDQLIRTLDSIRADRHNDHSHRALNQVPVLLRQLYGALDTTTSQTEREHLFSLLARTWGNASQLTYRLGGLTIAIALLDRMEQAADQAGEPLLAAHALQHRALLLMSHAAYDTGHRCVQRSLDLIGSSAEEGSIALAGSAHLRGAVLAARDRDADRAREHLAEAERLAAVIGCESEQFDTNFGPGNVMIHRVSVELECGDPGQAARTGSRIRLPRDVRATRAGRHWQDVARAWTMDGDHAAALKALNRARQIAPQQTRYHPQVHETMHVIVSEQRRSSASAAHFAHWLGMRT